mmetsp:Transcript_41064/g.63219  ORF Transcript_41064/g.63219 Transcript_41064/m.63219 type:complete len:203 (-) Transcript_41064:37-645(-)
MNKEIKRAASAPVHNQDTYNRLKERLDELKRAQPREAADSAVMIQKIKQTRKDLSDHLTTCHTVLETSSHCLENFFRHLPATRLQEAIDEKFNFFDSNHDATLDREEVREAMAEMGQRPTNDELDNFIKLFDHDEDGRIDQKEFSQMVLVKLRLAKLPDVMTGKAADVITAKPTQKVEIISKDAKKETTKPPRTKTAADVIG